MPPAVPHGKTTSGSWSATFPVDQESFQDSTLFMKRLLYVAFSQIISSRDLLPSNCFKKRRCENLRLYVFNTVIPEAFECADQLRAVCETIEKGYFRELHLNIFDEKRKADEIIEVYKMGVTYGDDKVSPSVTLSSNEMGRVEIDYKGKEVLKDQTRELLIRLHQITEKLADLPDTAQWTFYILYNDEKTPKGFQARGFNRRPEPYSIAPDAQKLVIGDSSANHHACHFEVTSVFIEDPVEFEELISGDLSAIQNSLRMDSRDTTIDVTTPTKDSNLVHNDTFDAIPPPSEDADPPKELKRRAKAGGGGVVADLEKAAQKMQIEDKNGNLISASSPEERQPAPKSMSPKKARQTKEKTASPSKTIKASKAVKKTPGNVGVRSSKKRARQ
ncbi:him-3 [Pristionchus pacificus]|uniref:Him-3 n=1 Tax=Pristionchus pacificus TaxID=54126 RepID=A0A2A6BJ06_PRIPA|nr:him-3 [Pristionchus pacificus]|eukprot:PDM65882.1 him-3 [Pristionchus pacificus]